MSIRCEVFNNTRTAVIHKMKESVGREQWQENMAFIETLRKKLRAHPINYHPMINCLNEGKVSKEALVKIHLEYRFAIVQIFTDALLMAQYQTRQLEPRFKSGIKMYPRFLLGLNIFDEFGFKIKPDQMNNLGSPDYAHYPLFENVLDELDIGHLARNRYMPSKAAKRVRHYLEDSFYSYTSLIALLAVVEVEVMLFSPPLRHALKNIGVDIENGYYFVHGTTEEHDVEATDDDHENDLWFTLAHACTEEDHINIKEVCMKYCELWERFWDEQLKHCKPFK
ncbi:hypothetical protein [Acinetobacter sp. A47]|uniref:hypothetical protein n=1 Tax=Acinetobacter sp. A47 TaxID=1561217 RepID=UPI0005712024|nr:hypothetical protein [Acinetobacter sp. A47]